MSCFIRSCSGETDDEDDEDDSGGSKTSCGKHGFSLRFLVLFPILK